ncbi:MAG TPA: response regulator transcription factor [Euryarchaeota archaeon]|nr:transcriptional activator protein CzcR [archaeon BMS3Bbin15]HDL15755.1 response regulator transcription factor [Euryarchaeota archaeon]
MITILVCDDEIVTLQGLKRILERDNYRVYVASNGNDALGVMEREKVDVLVTDIKLPTMNGFTLLEKVKENFSETKVIMITGYSCIGDAVYAIKKGASDYITKPIFIPDLKSSIKAVVEEAALEKLEGIDQKLSGMGENVFDSLIRAINNPLRREIIYFISEGEERSFYSIRKYIGILDASTLSFHLRCLKAYGLVSQNKDRDYFLMELGEKAAALLNIIR